MNEVDRESQLTAPERWEDKHLREYLNGPEIEKQNRWIGGTYDWNARAWKWGGEMREMNYQSFSRLRHLRPEDLQWHCIAMDPTIEYRWSPINCIKENYYICQAKLRKVRKTERNRLRQKWNAHGNGHKPNEIQVPNLTIFGNVYDKTEDNDLRNNIDTNTIDVHHQNNKHRKNNIYKNNAANRPYVNNNPKSYIYENLRNPNDTNNSAFAYLNRRRNSTRMNQRKRKPFPGYRENKENPESAYIHNVKALRSGRTGLSNAQIEKHLKRLERMRKKEINIEKRKDRMRDRQNRERSIVNDVENHDILQNRINNIKHRNLIDVENPKKSKNSKSKSKEKKNKKSSHSIENVTQKTYTMDNQLSALHPKTIVEVHDFSTE